MAPPSYKYTELQRQHPEWNATRLLNSNNKSKFTGKADVVVAGAGILGLCYAIQLKKISPDLKIELYEKSPEPIQKIGESTLSPFSIFTTDSMCAYDYLLRLFGMKDGLQFYGIDQEGRNVTANDLGGLDISFQLDRRMSELFLTMWAQSIGINVYHGVQIDFEIPPPMSAGLHIPGSWTEDAPSPQRIEPPRALLKDSQKLLGSSVDARMVCDASGFSRRLTSKFGAKEKLSGSWNTDAYWGYFRAKEQPSGIDPRLIHWDYPATKHMCFPEGWGWFIDIISWHHASTANLMDLVAHVIAAAQAGESPADFPSTQELGQMFDCPFENITSIGWAVRNDFKLPGDLSSYGDGEAEQKFNFFKQRYPTLNNLLNGAYEPLPNYYGRSYFTKKSLSYSSRQVAGDGWLAVGNAAGFTNPLISPGINVGIGGAWRAANLTKRILSAAPEEACGEMTRAAAEHQAYLHDFVLPRLNNMNRLWYNSFRDHRLFENIPKTLFACSAEALGGRFWGAKLEYTEKNSNWLVGAGLDAYQDFASQILNVLDGPNGGKQPSEEELAAALAICRDTLASRTSMWPENKWSRYQRQYDDRLQKVSGKIDRATGGTVRATHCPRCQTFVHSLTDTCPVCANTPVWATA